MNKNKLKAEILIPQLKAKIPDLVEGIGTPTSYTCPECSGPIREIQESSILHFRCQVGHGYSAEAMLAGRVEGLEAGLWGLVSSSEEARSLALLLARQARKEGLRDVAKDFEETAETFRAQSKELQRLVEKLPSPLFGPGRSRRRALGMTSPERAKSREPASARGR